MNSLDKQVGGDHYKEMPIQPVEFCQKNKLTFCESSAIKYICRHRSKNGKQDIEKAIHFLEMLLQLEYSEEEKPKYLLEVSNYLGRAVTEVKIHGDVMTIYYATGTSTTFHKIHGEFRDIEEILKGESTPKRITQTEHSQFLSRLTDYCGYTVVETGVDSIRKTIYTIGAEGAKIEYKWKYYPELLNIYTEFFGHPEESNET